MTKTITWFLTPGIAALLGCCVALLGGATPSLAQQNIGIVDDTGKACIPAVPPLAKSPNGCFDTSVLPSYTRAIQDQVNHDVLPLWPDGPTGAVTFKYYAGGSSMVPKGSWVVHVVTHTTVACAETINAAGCHNQIDGVPYAQVAYRYPSTYYSHEILEMWANPMLTRCLDVPHYGRAPAEIVDPFASLYYYGTGKVAVSDFATPAWFGVGTGALDFGNVVKIAAKGPGILPTNNTPPYAKLGFFGGGCNGN
jgi:hypothetical protein